MNQLVARGLGVDIWCAAALLYQHASHSSDRLVIKDGIVAISEREQKRRVLWQESHQAQHVFGQID
jgi:hypothetical protein